MNPNDYYSNADARLNTLLADDAQARMLKQAHEEWSRTAKPETAEVEQTLADSDSIRNDIQERRLFRSWLIMTYGIRLESNHLGYQLPYHIEDDAKHTIFLLKFRQ